MVGRVTSIYSSKGGVGKSFIAVNLAVDLHLETHRPVLLIDCGFPRSQDDGILLGMEGIKVLEPVLRSADTVSSAVLRTYASTHATGISVLALRRSGGSAGETTVRPEAVRLILGKLSQVYDDIVVDIGTKFDPIVETIMDLSDLVLIPATAELLSIKSTLEDLDLLKAKNFPRQRIRIVLNRVGMAGSLPAERVTGAFPLGLTAEIPYDVDAPEKLTGGATYPAQHPRHGVTKELDRIVYEILQVRPGASSAAAAVGVAAEGKSAAHAAEGVHELDAIKIKIHERLLDMIDLKPLDTEVESSPEKLEELRSVVSKKVVEIMDGEGWAPSRELRSRVVREVLQEALGLGVLEDLLADDSVSEIMVNRADQIYVERNGKIVPYEKTFLSERQLHGVIERIVSPLGRRIDASSPMVDARLPDGSRVNAVIPPLAPKGANVTIRKFFRDVLEMDELVRLGSVSRQMAEFLRAAVLARLNIVVSGGTGSGKTTLLNVLSRFIPEDERIITIEDSAELQLVQPHVISLEARPPNIEGKGEVSIRDLVKNSLRMRPDRIVVGECRGAEALDMLQAMNTGHDGSLTTIHSNSAREMLSRIETLVMFAGFELPSRAIREQIAGAVDIVVQLHRLKDGTRKIVQVAEVSGMEGDVITMGDVFTYKQSGVTPEGRVEGAFVSTGYVPRCLKRFEERGVAVAREVFWTTT